MLASQPAGTAPASTAVSTPVPPALVSCPVVWRSQYELTAVPVATGPFAMLTELLPTGRRADARGNRGTARTREWGQAARAAREGEDATTSRVKSGDSRHEAVILIAESPDECP